MSGGRDAGPDVRGSLAERLRRRGLLPRRLTIYLRLMAVLARTFDAAVVLRRARGGPWRAEVAEESMAPALRPGDWLLLDPTCRRWPRSGTIVVVREPGSGTLAVKRVAARGAARSPGPEGGPVPAEAARPLARVTLADGTTHVLRPREGWVLGDAPGASVDSRRYGPLDADDLVARAWFRYGPRGRIGRLR